VEVKGRVYMDPTGEGTFRPRIYLDEWPGAVLGANCMQDHAVVFDVDNRRMGWARADCMKLSDSVNPLSDSAVDNSISSSTPPPSPVNDSDSTDVVSNAEEESVSRLEKPGPGKAPFPMVAIVAFSAAAVLGVVVLMIQMHQKRARFVTKTLQRHQQDAADLAGAGILAAVHSHGGTRTHEAVVTTTVPNSAAVL
jgi:hypothetical protein